MVTRSNPASTSEIPRNIEANIAPPLVLALGATSVRAVRDTRQQGMRP